ncbi:MAG: pyruvate kinase [bacterium]|jgi:pyruvate kinase
MKKTKILCTIGPSCSSVITLKRMLDNGMNAVRINTSHGNFDQYHEMITNIRNVANIPIVMDTQGPKIRLRMKESRDIAAGEEVTVGFDPSHDLYMDAEIYEYIDAGDRTLIDDGNFEARITKKENQTIGLKFINGGHVTSGRAVNFPKRSLPLAPLTEKDLQSLKFAREMNVDFIALSFARGKDDINQCRAHLEGSQVKIISKIENQQGVDNFTEILRLSDGIMVARGDMGVELDAEEIPIIQKRLIKACNESGKLVITATQMLQSMIDSPRPTRAEISDVANAILDGSDIVMLSGETATGKYPVETVQMMNRIALYSEKFVHKPSTFVAGLGVERAICNSVKDLCESAGVNKIVTVTRRGHTARLISRLRLKPQILALTAREEAFRELHLYYGVLPVMYPELTGSIRTSTAGMFLFNEGLIASDDLVLFASGEYHPSEHLTNTLQLIRMRDLADYCERFGIC